MAAALAVVALAVSVLWAARDVTDTPLPSGAPASEPRDGAIATDSPPPTDDADDAAVAGDDDTAARVRSLVRQVSRIRRLRPQGRLRSRRVSPATLADKVTEIAFSEFDREQVAADERVLVALRLAPADIDLAESLEALYREQVLGLYVPKEKTLYVRGRGERSPAERITTAHEITHALQDQHFDIVAMQKAVEDDTDAGLAVLSLIEGDAVLTQQLWALRHLTQEEQQQAMAESGQGGAALADAPDYIRASLFFPYQQGAQFVGALFREGGFAAVNRAFRNPPATSEHILHPDRYLAGDGPEDVAVGPRPAPAWRRPVTYQFGEFDLRELLRVLGDSTAETASTGWDGGELRMWSRGDDVAVAAALAFDTPEDAREACDAIPRWYAEVAQGRSAGDGTYDGDRDHLGLRCTTLEVRFGLGPDRETARRTVASP